MCVGTVVLGGTRAAGLAATLARNFGGVELTRLASFVAFMLLLIFAVRRRQDGAINGAVQILVAIAGSSLLAIALVWPLLPRSLPVSLVTVLQHDAHDQLVTILLGIPTATLLVWLSRRWGSDSSVTERRWRVVLNAMRERANRRRHPR